MNVRKLLAMFIIMCVAGGIGPLAGLASAEQRLEGKSPTPPYQACLSLTQLNSERQAIAKRVAQSAEPVATYREEIERARQVLALQPYECLASLRSALIRDQGTWLVQLREGSGDGTALDPGLERSIERGIHDMREIGRIEELGLGYLERLVVNGTLALDVVVGFAVLNYELLNKLARNGLMRDLAKGPTQRGEREGGRGGAGGGEGGGDR